MFLLKTKKIALTTLGLVLLTFLLLALAGCDATSDPRQSYQATGSWQGTINNEPVRGLIAPDGSYHLAIVDAQGIFIGEYVGKIGFIDPENIGSMTLQRLHVTESAGAPQGVTFKLSADRLYSVQGIELSPTPEANGPATLGDVVGRWSLSAADNLTAVVVDEAGILSGGDGNCQYTGSLELIDPAWNIYRLALTTADITSLSCPQRGVSYTGLAMKSGKEEARPRLWFAANALQKIALGEWSKTINVAPVAQMTILGERADQSVLVQEGAAVELDAQGSSDANNDALTYAWSGVAPDGTTLNIPGTGRTITFIPAMEGSYNLTLTVNDGITTNTLDRQLRVVWTLDRFIGCGNGTVLDTRTNLLWLRDAGCVALNQGSSRGVTHADALERVALLASVSCDLNDNSVLGDWRLPTLKDFSYIVPQRQWSEGNPFVNVGTNPDPAGQPLPFYWTAEPDPVVARNWYFINTSYVAPADWFGSYFENNATAVWPVRALRPGEQCPVVP